MITIDIVHGLFEAIREENVNPILRTTDTKNILEGNPVAKNIYVAVYGDGMIKNGGFDMYLYEIRLGKITNAKVKQAFKEIGFNAGLEILNKAKRSADLDTLDMAYYQLEEEFETSLIKYLQKEWNNPEFIDYCLSISYKRAE